MRIQTLPQRSVASRILPQRSIVSRNKTGGCGCKLGSGAAAYFWADLFDNTFTLKKTAAAYNTPFPGGYVLRWLPAGTPLFLYSYVNSQGKTFILVYPVNFGLVDNTRLFAIELQGPAASQFTIPVETFNSLFNPKADNPTIMTNIEKDETENPKDITQRILDGLKTVVFIGGGLYLVGKLIK